MVQRRRQGYIASDVEETGRKADVELGPDAIIVRAGLIPASKLIY
jgi:hypothetical protein